MLPWVSDSMLLLFFAILRLHNIDVSRCISAHFNPPDYVFTNLRCRVTIYSAERICDGAMRGLKFARRYADLTLISATVSKDARSDRDQRPSAHEFLRVAREARTMRNTKQMKRLIDRMTKRHESFAVNAARDARLLVELGERNELHDAQASRRQWFIIGRLVARAAADDANWQEVLQHLVEQSPLSARDARALGLTRA